MNISVIIPVLNAEKYIGKCIDSIRNLDTSDDNIEIFVVDNGSIDSTIDILNHKNVNFTICKDGNISKLRNLGAKSTRGEFLGFIDSDCFVDSRWLQEAKRVFIKSSEVAVVGRYYGMSDNSTWVERVWFDMKKDIDGYIKFLPGGNMLFRRDVFEMIHGFNEELVTGEDYEICESKLYKKKDIHTVWG